MTTFKTPSGSTWNTSIPIRTSLSVSNPRLTGKFEINSRGNDFDVLLEVCHDFGTDFIFEDFISQ